MTNEQFPQEVASFYEDLSLSGGAMESIVEMRHTMLKRRKWKRIAGALAAVLILVLGAYSFVRQGTETNGSDLIAVKIYNDECGKCKAMGNVFAELQRDLEGRRILFLTLDVSEAVTHGQSLLLGEILGIRDSLEGIGPGTIVLLDRRGQLLKKLDGTAGRQYLANQIAMRL